MSIKRIALVIIFVFIASTTFSQTTSEEPLYYDINWKRVYAKEAAAYYRSAEKKENSWLVKTWYVTDTLQSELTCSQYPNLKFDGPAKYYYQNGKLSKEVTYRDSKEVGVRKLFYENGIAKTTADLDGEKLRYILYQDKDGKDLLRGGTAIIALPNEYTDSIAKLRSEFEDVKDFILIGSFFTENGGRDTTYYTTEVQATYPGGYGQVGLHISSTLKYPKNARTYGLEGRTLVQFVIERSGEVTNAKVYKGFDRECDAEAVRSVSTLSAWNPSLHRGKPVRCMFLLPVAFRLEDEPLVEPETEKNKKKNKRKH